MFIAIEDQHWTNGERWCGIIRVYDGFKDRSEIGTIIKNLSLIKRNDDLVINENGRSSNC
jgi:hypothetical protein